jgi:hypothetical protein
MNKNLFAFYQSALNINPESESVLTLLYVKYQKLWNVNT